MKPSGHVSSMGTSQEAVRGLSRRTWFNTFETFEAGMLLKNLEVVADSHCIATVRPERLSVVRS
jgi:hypothetical protein